MQTTSLIGRRCKHSNVFSWPILIDRGLEPPYSCKQQSSTTTKRCRQHPTTATVGYVGVQKKSLSFGFQNSAVYLFRLVEKDTRKRTISVFIAEGPPVPIPNTEVKLCYGEDTYLETSRENSSMLMQKCPRITDRSWCFYRRGSTCSHSEHRS